jgi:hypothetical protein
MRFRSIGLAAIAILVLAVLSPAPGYAQSSQGRVTGIVTDSQGAVLPGVTVTASSPALIGTRSAVTEADGRYLFASLPTGAYKLAFDLQGFKQSVRENIQVVLGQTISADAELQLGQLTESVTVSGASPVVDVTTTRIGTSLKGEALIAVPTSTDTWGALSEAPGVRMTGFDVGGSHKSQQSGYESFGVQNQSRVVTEGVDHTEGVGGTGFYEDYYANEEVSISSLGSDVEMNSPGAAVVSMIKSGGNRFQGLENFAYEPGKFVGSNGAPSDVSGRGYACPANAAGALECDNPNLLFWEGHADLGGPILRDKIWFYAAYNQFHIDKQVAGVSRNVATDLGLFNNQTVKGTGKLTQNNTLVGYYQRGRKQKPERNLSTLVPPESILAQDSVSWMAKGEWQSVISNRTFLSVNGGEFHLAWPMVPAVDAAVSPPVLFQANNSQLGAGWNAFTSERRKPQVKAQLTYYLPDKGGSHDFKFGFESIYDWYRLGINGQSGPYRVYVNPAGEVYRLRFADVGPASSYATGWTTGANIDKHFSGYLQDRWAPTNRVTISAGVRIDYQDVGYSSAERRPVISDISPVDGTQVFPAATNISSASFFKNTDVAPRVGVSVSLDNKGMTVLKAFYGRYYNNLADGFSAANPGGTSYADYNFTDLNGNGKYDGPAELGSLRARLGGADAPVDPNSKTPYTDEYSVTMERQFWGESSVRATYVRKMQKEFLPFYFTPLVTAWIGNVNVPTVATFNGRTYNLLDVPDSLANATGTEYTNYADGKFTYDTIEGAFNKRAGKLFVQASADYQWRNELVSADQVNNTGGSTSPLSTAPFGVFPQLSPNPNAPNRQKTTGYGAQLAGRYEFKYDIGVALNYRFQSGFPYAAIVPDGSVDLNLCNFECSFLQQNLDQNRSENVHLMNFRIDKSVPLGRGAKATVMLDIYNLLNADPVTNFNLNDGPGYKTVIAVLDPRVFQVGVRLQF